MGVEVLCSSISDLPTEDSLPQFVISIFCLHVILLFFQFSSSYRLSHYGSVKGHFPQTFQGIMAQALICCDVLYL